MNILAVVGSPRKNKATDLLINRAIEGAQSRRPDFSVKKIHLADYNIGYCRNCLACRMSTTLQAAAACTMRDDMDIIMPDLLASDFLIFGTPVHMTNLTALMMTFLERVCWTMAKPKGRFPGLKGIPVPRSSKKRKAGIIVTSGVIPPVLRRFGDRATPTIKTVLDHSLNAKIMDEFYAGNIEGRGSAYYYRRAFRLGEKLVK